MKKYREYLKVNPVYRISIYVAIGAMLLGFVELVAFWIGLGLLVVFGLLGWFDSRKL